MIALASRLEDGTVVEQRIGHVLARESDVFSVALGKERRTAHRAASCLLEPRLGDTVLLATTGAGTAWMLAVLERSDTSAVLAFEGDVTVKSKGRVTLASSAGTDLVSKGDIQIASERVRVQAKEGEAFLERAALFGTHLVATVEAVKTVASVIDRVATRISERAQRVYRRVEEADYLRSGHIDYASENAIAMQAKNTVITSEQLTKLNGDQIHLG